MALSLWEDPLLMHPRYDEFGALIPAEFRGLMDWPYYNRNPWRTLEQQLAQLDVGGGDVRFDKDKFQANIDVQHFKPEEIEVKVSGDTVTVEGKHEEKKDEHGYISRQFTRKYVLPKGHDINRIESKLSSDGILTITAPKVEENEPSHRTIPIKFTGKLSKAIKGKKEKK